MPQTWPDGSHEIDRRMALAREWNQLIDQVRQLPGFDDFLRPVSLPALLPALGDGPIAIINVSRWRCDALIVTPDGVDAVELPHLSLAEVIDRVNFYLHTLGRFQVASLTLQTAGKTFLDSPRTDADRDAYERAIQDYNVERGDMEQSLSVVLEWCWDAIAEPILEHLGRTAPPSPGEPWRRVWWCPTGPLTLLPLHAAGRDDGNGAAVIDRVISSYTPTLRALAEARKPRPETGVRDALLVVAMPDTRGQPALPNVHREVKILSQLGVKTTLLQGADATIAAVSAALTTHSWVHFSCHGGQNLTDPSRGGLLLHDGMLTITDISARQYHGELAFLSACKTATGGTTLPDEAITLAAALHYTGYRHVIATLWSVWDESAANVTEAVYHDITQGATLRVGRCAQALHDAVRLLRAANPGRPSVWTPFTHTGP